MAGNNMRIIYNNLVDLYATTVSASTTQSGSTTAANLTKDTKALVWRSAATTTSTTNVTAMLAVSFASSAIGGVVLPFTNIVSSSALIRVQGFSGAGLATVGGTADAPTSAVGTTSVFDSGYILACPWNSLNLASWNGSTATGAVTYAYGGGTYLRYWNTSQPTCTSLIITLVDIYPTAATGRYIEASRLFVGPYWSPTFNVSFGISTTIKDLSTQERTESGDLLTKRGPRYNAMSFDLKYLNNADRLNLTKFLLANGISRSLLISAFPNNSDDWERERLHQMACKVMQPPAVQYFGLDAYSTSLDVEEI